MRFMVGWRETGPSDPAQGWVPNCAMRVEAVRPGSLCRSKIRGHKSQGSDFYSLEVCQRRAEGKICLGGFLPPPYDSVGQDGATNVNLKPAVEKLAVQILAWRALYTSAAGPSSSPSWPRELERFSQWG